MFEHVAEMLGIKPKSQYVGGGSRRAVVREHIHRKMQAVRVEPALATFAEQRKAIARRRVKRWQRKHPLDEAPGHIKAMSREQR